MGLPTPVVVGVSLMLTAMQRPQLIPDIPATVGAVSIIRVRGVPRRAPTLVSALRPSDAAPLGIMLGRDHGTNWVLTLASGMGMGLGCVHLRPPAEDVRRAHAHGRPLF